MRNSRRLIVKNFRSMLAKSAHAIPAPIWFVAALIPMVVSQILRLQQSDPATWIFWDYAGRLGGLAVLGAIPSARIVAFQRGRLRIALWEATIWIVGIVLFDHYLCGWIRRTLNAALPATVLGGFPETKGWLHIVDVAFGLALVAFSEEIVFRRCARQLFRIYMNDDYALVVVTSVLFGAYHWWTGVGNILEAALMGVLFMLFYRRSGALWPVVLAHYLTDVVDFAL
jgi:membrane protease YdiL (CAAX protease family)